MMSFPIQILPSDLATEAADLNAKISRGMENLNTLKDSDIDIGSTPKDVAYTNDRIKVYHYHPVVEESKILKTPLLIMPPLINGYEVADLQPDRSLVRNLLNEGLDVYLHDWGYPRRVDRYLTVSDHVNGYIDDTVDFIRKKHGVDKIAILGICQGGTLSTVYSTLHQDKIGYLVLTVSPIDFEAYRGVSKPHEGLMFTLGSDVDVDKMVDAYGNVPADVLNVSFLMASPFILNFGKYADVVDILGDRGALLNFLRMEKWLFGGPNASGETYKEFVKEFLQGNKLVKGEIMIDGERVDLKDLKIPVLSIYAEKDHIVPPPCTTALGKHVGTKDYTEVMIKTGHIGIYTGGASQKILAPTVGKWLRERVG